MRCALLLPLLCALASTYAQDSRVCSYPDTDGPLLPTIDGTVFVSGFEKKEKVASTSSPYNFVYSGVHTFASATDTQPPREAVKALRIRGAYKHVMDHSVYQALVINADDEWADDGCVVKTFDEYATSDDAITRLVGVDKVRKPVLGPLGVFFLNVIAKQIGSDVTHNNQAVDQYMSCYWDQAQSLTASFIWWYIKGTTTPAAAMLLYSQSETGLVRQVEYDFFDFQSFPDIGTQPFELPQFTICKNWKHQKPPQNLTKTFAFDSEVLMIRNNDSLPSLIVSYTDQMDVVYNLSRRVTTSGQMDGSVVTLTDVFDGTSGVLYTIDDRVGTCGMSVPSTSSSDNSQAHLLNPADFWQSQDKMYYGGQKTWRGMLCETLVYEQESAVTRDPMRYELYIAISTDALRLPVSQMPVAQLVRARPGTGTAHYDVSKLYQQVFNYDVNTATIADYDVSACYVLENQRHFIMTFPAWAWLIETYPDLVQDAFIRTAAAVTKVSPIRISMVEVESTDYLHVTFTMLHYNNVSGAQVQTHLSTAVNTLFAAVDAGTFTVTLRYQVDQSVTITATDMVEVPRRTPLNWFRGFSGGDMAAIALSMFFGSLILAILLFYFVVAPYYQPNISGGTTLSNPSFAS